MKRLLAAIAAAVISTAMLVITAPSAAAVSCKAVNHPVYLTLSRYLYSGGGMSLTAGGTKTYHEVVSLAPDIDWTFYAFTGAGLQSRYSTPTTWGNVNNRLPVKTYTVTVTFKRVDTLGNVKPNRTITCSI